MVGECYLDHPSWFQCLGLPSIYKLQAMFMAIWKGKPTTPSLGDNNDHHGYEPLTWTRHGMILQVVVKVFQAFTNLWNHLLVNTF